MTLDNFSLAGRKASEINMNIPTFSIIIPVYKVENYIDDCIKSVLDQSYSDFELILVDDGSPDRCGKIIDGYAKRDSRIKVLHKPNGGVVSARMAGTELASGEYIMNIDGDDFIAENCLEILASHISKTHSDIYCFGFYKYTDCRVSEDLPRLPEGEYNTKDKKNELFARIIYDKSRPFYTFGLCPSVWSRITKRELYTKWQMRIDQSIIIGEDLAMTVPMMMDAETICILSKPLYYYRILPFSVSHRFNMHTMNCVSTIVTMFKDPSVMDIEQYDLKAQIGAYCTDVIFNHLFSFASIAGSYKEYIAHIKNIDKVVFEFIKHCRYDLSSLRSAFIIMLIKHKLWWVLWQLAGKRGKNNG